MAIDSAFARGAGAVEVDVASTRDTILVLLHDFDVARTTDGHGIVRELTFQEIAQLDACSWFGSEWAPCSVPTLRSALEAVRTREEGVLVLDLKGPFSRGHVDRLLEDIRLAGMLDRVEIISSSILNLSTLRSRDSIVAASYIKVDTTGLGQLDKLRSRAFFLSLDVLFGEPSLIDTLRVRGLEVGGWTADSRERIEAVVGMGVERVVSDVPLR